MPSPTEQRSLRPPAPHSAAVGQRLADLFEISGAPSLVTTTYRAGNLAVTEIWSDDPVIRITDPVPTEDAYLLCYLIDEMVDHQIWEDGHALPRRTFGAGSFIQRDLKRSQAALIDQPHHSLHFYLPRAALDDLAEDAGATRVGELSYEPGVPICDPVVSALATSLRLALASPHEANRPFVDHVLTAMGAHVATAYGGMRERAAVHAGGLARWQEKRAKEMLSADLGGTTPLAVIAGECGLSVSQFSRAFKKSVGVAPHRWLIQQRVETAKSGLADPSVPLAELALACGFADQSHLTRVFAWHTGLTPAAWRRGT